MDHSHSTSAGGRTCPGAGQFTASLKACGIDYGLPQAPETRSSRRPRMAIRTSKVKFTRCCQLLARKAHTTAPKTSKRLQARAPDDPRRTLRGALRPTGVDTIGITKPSQTWEFQIRHFEAQRVSRYKNKLCPSWQERQLPNLLGVFPG